MGGEEGSYSPMIRSHSLSEPMPLDFELHKCLIFFFSLPLGERGWLEWPGVGYFPSPAKSVSDHIPAI